MDKHQILLLNNISGHGLGRLPHDRYATGKHVEQPDAILVRSHDMHGMAIPASVKAIGRAGGRRRGCVDGICRRRLQPWPRWNSRIQSTSACTPSTGMAL